MFLNEFLLNSGPASTAWPIKHTLYQKLQNIVSYYAIQKKPDFKLCSPVFISFKREHLRQWFSVIYRRIDLGIVGDTEYLN